MRDVNSLLGHRERIVRRALAKAGDLAHGLKTPLALLAQEAEQAKAAGEYETASTISLHVSAPPWRRIADVHLMNRSGIRDNPFRITVAAVAPDQSG